MSPVARYCDRYPRRVRWVYGLISGGVALALCLLTSFFLAHFTSINTGDVSVFLFITVPLSACLSAVLTWAVIDHRTVRYMISQSFFTTFIAHFIMGIFVGAAYMWGDLKHINDVSAKEIVFSILFNLAYIPIIFGFFGNIFSFGIPYAIGGLASLLFVNVGKHNEKIQ